MENNLDIRTARMRQGLTQREFRDKLAEGGWVLPQATVSHMETGKRLPGTLDQVQLMASILNLPVSQLENHFADLYAIQCRDRYAKRLRSNEPRVRKGKWVAV